MAGVAICAVIDIVANASMLLVHDGLVMGMAVETAEHGIVRGIGVAIIAGIPLPSVRAGINWELMVEGSPRPSSGVVTAFAGFGESRRKMIWIGNRFVFFPVATVTVSRRTRISSSDVTTYTAHRCVRASKRKTRPAVVKHGALPLGGAVASLAAGWKTCRRVVRIGSGVVVLQMTRDTRSIQPGVLPIAVTTRASERNMRPSQREPGL